MSSISVSSASPARPQTICPICGGTWTSAGGNDKGNRSRHESSKKHKNAVATAPPAAVQVQAPVQVVEEEVPVVRAQAQEAEVMAYPNQMAAAKKIIAEFEDKCRWIVLLAFPQSGKTQTFLYVACNMLCTNPKIDRAVIVCGNAENELSEQLRASKTEFIRMYIQNEYPNSCNQIAILESRIQVWCGAELEHNAAQPTVARNTLFIWEEAHYAQDKTNRPHKFFKNLCITADGEISNLEGERNNYVLTVSATPFSEMSNIWHHKQNKRIVRLEPAAGYKGPKHFLQAGSIVQFDPRLSPAEVVAQAIREAPMKAAAKYAIVRVRDSKGTDNMSACIRVAAEHGWAHRVYDSETKHHQPGSMQSMDELAIAPQQNTVIFIRGMCRMGKRVPKQHISFVIETAKASKTDVVLQGLMGRMFGFHDNMDIKIYISSRIEMADIEEYVRTLENPESMTMPSSGKNLVSGPKCRNGEWYNNIPIVIRRNMQQLDEHDDPNAEEYENELTIQAIQAAFESGAIENYNCDEQTAEIREQIMHLTAEPRRMSPRNFVNPSTRRLYTTYQEMPDKLRDSIDQRMPFNTGSNGGCGFDSTEEMQVNVWRCNTNQFSLTHGFNRGDLIVHTRTRVASDEQLLKERIPGTTGMETFSTQQEDGSVIIGNGGYNIQLAVETSYDIQKMQENLRDLIRESRVEDSLQRPKCITSNHDGVSEWKGIIVSLEIMRALERGGRIYDHIKRECGTTLKLTKALGRELKSLKSMGNARLVKIEWD